MSEKIQLAHGGGGRLSSDLIHDEILARFGDGPLSDLPDAALLEFGGDKLVFSTDSFVVHPLEFPGGNIGVLAIHGTVNDISVAGGKPLWISLGLIIEEGLELDTLRKILDSVKSAADNCGISVVTGDTKVVARGQADGIYINTAGIGVAMERFNLSTGSIQVGDNVLVSGPIGDHGMAVLSVREGIDIENGPMSDTGSVQRLVEAAHNYGDKVRFMRDPTRGGIAAVLNEIVDGLGVGILLDEDRIPLSAGTKTVAELIGISLLGVACEGRMILICDDSVTEDILGAWKKLPEGEDAALIGSVTEDAGRVNLKTFTGGIRIVDVPQGELLPRIC